MKNCINCGVQLADDVKYCPQCGTKQEEAPQHAAPKTAGTTRSADNMSPEELVKGLTEALPVTQELYNLVSMEEALKKKLQSAQTIHGWVDKFTRGGIAFMASGIVLCIAVGVLSPLINRIPIISMIMLGGWIFVMIQITEFLKGNALFSSIADQFYSDIGAGSRQIEEYPLQIGDTRNQINKLVRENWDNLCWIPEDYLYPVAVEYIRKYLEQGRAQSLGEALNLFDEQTHRWTMEDAQSRMIRNQKEMMFQLDLISLSM